jgi:hypothetical protein
MSHQATVPGYMLTGTLAQLSEYCTPLKPVTLLSAHYIASNGRMWMNGELEKIRKEAVVADVILTFCWIH